MRQRKRKFPSRPRIDGVVVKQAECRKFRRKRRRYFPVLREVEIIYHRPRIKRATKITNSKEVYDLLIGLFDPRKIDYKEMFYVVLLSRSNHCLWYSQINVGSDAGVVVNIKEILQLVLKTNASGIILAHNHPSGNLKPSNPDIELTRKVQAGCRLFDIQMLDHIILSSEGYTSMQDEGLM